MESECGHLYLLLLDAGEHCGIYRCTDCGEHMVLERAVLELSGRHWSPAR